MGSQSITGHTHMLTLILWEETDQTQGEDANFVHTDPMRESNPDPAGAKRKYKPLRHHATYIHSLVTIIIKHM